MNIDSTAIGSALDLAKNVTVISLLVAALWGGVRGWWVFGWVFRSQVEETERWRSIALRLMNVTEGSIEIAKPRAPAATGDD